MLALSSAALAAPAGFVESHQSGPCTMYTGPRSAAGTTPLLAECVWADVTLAQAEARLSDWARHDEVFSSIASSVVERTEGDAAYVRQVHVARGIAERECVLRMTKTQEGAGIRFAWTLDPSFATPADGRVLVAKDDGSWLFVPDPAGGVKLSYSLDYGPGGSVPSLLVRWFQGSGFDAAVVELHDWILGR